VHITLHTVTFHRHIGAQPATAGMVFLIIDVEITNHGAFGHLFDPARTALTTREGTDYGRALASFIPIHGANDDADMLQATPALRHYEAALTAQVGGFATVIESQLSRQDKGGSCITYRRRAVHMCLCIAMRLLRLRYPFSVHV
jgi:hypothetical protein